MARVKTKPAPWKTGVRIGGGVVIAVGAAYLLGHFLAGDDLPRNAEISGVAVGGMPPAAAEAKLRQALESRESEVLTLSAGDKTVKVTPSEAGLWVDYPASIARSLEGSNWNPITIVSILFGGSKDEAVIGVDQAKLDAVVESLAKQVDTPATSAGISYSGLTPVVSESKDGETVDRVATATSLKKAYLSSVEVAAVVVPEPAQVATAQANEAAAGVAKQAVAAPVTVNVGTEGKIDITPKMLAACLSFEAKESVLSPVIDPKKLAAQVDQPLKELGLKQPKDASYTIAGNRSAKPKLVPAVTGKGIDPAELAGSLVSVVGQVGSRSVSVEVTTSEASLSTDEAEKLGVKEIIGEFTTYFPGSGYRYNNIGKAARLINGTFLKPGEIFSMNKVLGKRTTASGWMSGGAIDGGQVVQRMGGGISQATTTAFNAIFFAGLEDIYHKPHSLYFSRYPVGREATLDWESVDMKFRNDSPHGVLMQAWITGKPGSQGSVTVKVWSTKRYTIRASDPVRSNYRNPGPTIYDESPDCVAQSAMTGFNVKYNRLFYRGEKLVKTEPFSWTYSSLTPRVCGRKGS